MYRCALVVLFVALVLAGCGGNELELHEVTGTVKYKDGGVPQGDPAPTVTFTPADPTQGKGASSSIAPDGSFKLFTVRQGDGGALAGDYRVTVTAMQGYPAGRPLVASQYSNFNETPLTATVKPDEPNEFHFEVDKP